MTSATNAADVTRTNQDFDDVRRCAWRRGAEVGATAAAAARLGWRGTRGAGVCAPNDRHKRDERTIPPGAPTATDETKRRGGKRRCKPFTVGGREAGGRKRADRQRKRCRLQRAQSPRRLQRDQRRRRRSGSDRGNTWDARGTDRETEGSRACGRRLRHARQLPRSY